MSIRRHSPANTGRNPRGVPRGYHFLPEGEIERRMKALREHPSNAAAAQSLGISENSLTTWRMRHGIPSKLGPGKGRLLPPEEEARRRKLYEAGFSDVEAAERLGICTGAFSSWRFYHGLKGLKDPGPRPLQRVSRTQRRLLAYLEENGWSTVEIIAVRLGRHASGVRDSLNRLWKRGYVTCCLHERKKKFALPEADLPERAMKFKADFPNPYYHIGVKEEVLGVLDGRPWLMRWEILEAMAPGLTDGSVQYALRMLGQMREVKSRLHPMPNGLVRLWALKDAPSFRGPHSVRVQKAFIEHTGKGAVPPAILEYVGKHPWSTVQEIADGIQRPYSTTVQWTPRLEKEGRLQRILVAEGVPGRHGQGTHRDHWALASVKRPEGWVDARDVSSMAVARLRLAQIVRDHPGSVAAEITASYRKRHGKGTYIWICHHLARLNELGVLNRNQRGGRKADRWYPNGKAVIDLTTRTADAYYRAIDASAMKLRKLGYDVTIEVKPNEA